MQNPIVRTKNQRTTSGARLARFALALSLAGAWAVTPVARAQQAEEAPPSPRVLLRAMTDYLSAQQAFSFRIETSFENFDQGQKLQFEGSADISVRRPNRLAIDYRDDLSARRVWYDGSQLTLVDPRDNLYASMKAPSSLDTMLDHFEEQYGLVLPLTDLIGEDAYSLIASRAKSASYVGLHQVGGTACHHLAFVGELADLQLWIQDGDSPAPCKFVVDYKEQPGRPEYAVVMMGWEFGKKLSDSQFNPTIPEGARKVEFLRIQEAGR